MPLLSRCRSAVLAALVLAPVLCGPVQAQSFEELIEGILGREEGGTEDPAAPGVLQPNTTTTAPTQPSAPQLIPVEPGPRPYTPPSGGTVQTTDDTAPSGGAAGDGPTSGGTTTQPSPDNAPPAAADAPADATGVEIVAPSPSGPQPTGAPLQAAAVNAATFSEAALAAPGANPLILKAQVLLDRAGASPGAIDGHASSSFAKAIAAVETVLRVVADGRLDREVWQALRGDTTQDVLVQYAITPQDLAYPFTAAIPADLAERALLPSLGYTSPEEMLAERFHMDVALLKALNAGADFTRTGTLVWVASVEGVPMDARLVSVVADKVAGQLRGFDAQNRLIAAYPATIGSTGGAAPSGGYWVESIATNPIFTFDPGAFASRPAPPIRSAPSGSASPARPAAFLAPPIR